MRPAIIHAAVRQIIRSFPPDVKRSLGKAIWDLQRGFSLGMPLARPMPAVAPGVSELRIKEATGIYRAFYLTQSSRAVLVFHAFVKKTQKTPKSELATGRRRLKEMLREEAT